MPIITTDNRSAVAVSSSNDLPPSELAARPDPLVTAYNGDIGPRAADRLGEMRSEFGLSTVSRRNAADRLFNFTEGTALGLQFETKAYKSSDPYVLKSPVRHAVAENLRAQFGGRSVAFVESAGLVDLGGGYQNVVPIDAFFMGGFGFVTGATGGGLLHYRTSTPQVLGLGETRLDPKTPKVAIPWNGALAAKMTPGSEFEIAGEGRISRVFGGGARFGPSVPGSTVAATGGVGGVFNFTNILEGEFSVSILALDKPGQVRVTLRKIDENTASILTRIRGGVIFGAGSLVPQPAGGILRYYTEKLGVPNFEEYVNLYTTLNSCQYGRVVARGIAIGAYDIDLNTQSGKDAYNSLMYLNPIAAEELAAGDNPAVTYVHNKESDTDFKIGADLRFANLKLFAYEVLNTERRGRIDDASGGQLVYRDNLYQRSKKNFLSGNTSVSWEAVSMTHPDTKERQSFLRMLYQKNDFDFEQNGVSRMLRFADAVGVLRSEMTGDDEKKFAAVKDKICRMKEVDTTVDVYFTSQGIDNIDRADAAAAKEAYLMASAQVVKKYEGIDRVLSEGKMPQALELIAEYRAHTGIQHLMTSERLKLVPQLRKQYRELTGRDIARDARLMGKAESFGKSVERLTDSRNAEQVASFMTELGQEKGFDFRQSIAALARLAGPEETLLHNLSIEGGPYTIRNNAEGELLNPRDIFAAELSRLAANT